MLLKILPSLISAVRGLEKYSVITKCGYYNSGGLYALGTQLKDGSYINVIAINERVVDKSYGSNIILERVSHEKFYSLETDENLNNLINPYEFNNFIYFGPHILPKDGQELTNAKEEFKYWYDNPEGIVELRKNFIAYLIKNWKGLLFKCKFVNNVTYLKPSENGETLESFYDKNKHLFNNDMKCVFDNIKIFYENNPGILDSIENLKIIDHIIFKEAYEETLLQKLVNLIDVKVDPLNKETDGGGLINSLLDFFNDLLGN